MSWSLFKEPGHKPFEKARRHQVTARQLDLQTPLARSIALLFFPSTTVALQSHPINQLLPPTTGER